MDGTSLPQVITAVPGPRSVEQVARLARTECPAITARRARRAGETGVEQDPIVWERARGANVMDVDGNVYVDLTSAFGVCGLGHSHPAVVDAARAQVGRLIHAMGDVYPSDVKIELCERLAQIAPSGLAQSILGLSGSSSVESAIKTAMIATGRPGFVVFEGSYHGLSIGALALSTYKEAFRRPFIDGLNPHVCTAPFPGPNDDAHKALDVVRRHLADHDIAAVVVEPIQGRGGIVEPPDAFLPTLRAICNDHQTLLIADEIFTGLGRTGTMWACDAAAVCPDILCLGKALGGGFPISAAIGSQEVMQAWGASGGEAIHTQTFLGNPLGCAMALAALDVLVDEHWCDAVRNRGQQLAAKLGARGFAVRGRGFMLGVEVRDVRVALHVTDYCRQQGYLVLPAGPGAEVIGITPPFVITDEQLDAFLDVLEKAVENAERSV